MKQRVKSLRSKGSHQKHPVLFTSGIIVGLLVLVAVTWMIAWKVQSPAQRDAAKEPPAALPVTVAIARGDLHDTRALAAHIQSIQPLEITLPVFSEPAIVSRQGIPAGEQLYPGKAITWINDRPVIALPGDFPLWRDLHEGDRGSDVAALQKGLQKVGFSLSVDGIYGPATTKAITTLYSRLDSYVPVASISSPTTSESQADTGQEQEVKTVASAVSKPYTSRNEIVFIPNLPATIEKVPPVGSKLSGDSARITVNQGEVGLAAITDGSTAATLSVGMNATANVGDQSISLTLDSITADANGSEGTNAGTSTVIFKPVENSEALSSVNSDLPITVTVSLSAPLENMLLVPERAVATNKAGDTNILLIRDGSSTQLVQVEVSGCANGICGISSSDTSVVEGALVRVDRES